MIKRLSTSQLIVKDIQDKILDKVYQAGDKLPTERGLAEQYGVSRIPIREALKTLAEIGLVETRHGSGTYIREIGPEKIAERMTQFLHMSGQSATELLLLRKLLETQAAKDAALKRSSEEMRRIKRLCQACSQEIHRQQSGLPHDFQRADFAFHHAVAEASHNQLFLNFINVIHSSISVHQTILSSEPSNMERIENHHLELCRALEEGDESGAGSAMEKHLDHVTSVIQAGLAELGRRQSRIHP